MKKYQPSEHQEQVALVAKLRKDGFFVFAIPNGGIRDLGTRISLTHEGVLAGIPDLCIALEGGSVLWIELKTRKGGQISKAQKEIHKQLENIGHKVIIGRGAKEAYDAILQFTRR